MNSRYVAVLCALCASLAACTPEVPRTTEELKTSLTKVGEATQEAAQKAPEIAESARETLQKVGETTMAATDAARQGLEAVGDTVLNVTAPPAPTSAPAEQR